MRKLVLIAILLLMGTSIGSAELIDMAETMTPFVVSVSSFANTEIVAANGNNRDVWIYPSSLNFYLGYDTDMSTSTTAVVFPKQSETYLPQILRNYTGSLYGIASDTDTAVTVRGFVVK